MKIATKLWLGIGILTVLSPLGIILPEHFKASAPFNQKLSGFWNAPITNYTLKSGEQKSLPRLSLDYIISAIIGILAIAIAALIIGKILSKKDSQ